MPVYVIINPAIGEAVEQYFISELTKAYEIIDVLMETSREVCCLKEQLRQKITRCQRSLCRERLTKMFVSALDQGGTLPRLVRIFARMVAYNTVRDIGFGSARVTNSIVIYYRCKTVKALYELSQMIVSGFMGAVFAAAVESLVHRPTTVDVYVRADDFNCALLRLSSPQGTGKSVTDTHNNSSCLVALYLEQ